MSRRTSEASKAIREAWEREQQLVSQGKGTRDWTPEQQKSIIDKGKAYDEDGIAYVGHHMKSAEAFPEYQGDSTNIQFLSHSEHLKAHDGNWQNPTNWYYDPITETKHEFGTGKHKPCEIITLSEPLHGRQSPLSGTGEKTQSDKKLAGQQIEKSGVPPNVEPPEKSRSYELPNIDRDRHLSSHKGNSLGKRLMNAINPIISPIADFTDKHPVVVELVKSIGMEVIKRKVAKKFKSLSIGGKQSRKETPYIEDMIKSDYPSKRDFPNGPDVRGHKQRYHTKQGVAVSE